MGKFYSSRHSTRDGHMRDFRHRSETRHMRKKNHAGVMKAVKVKPVEKQMALFALAGLVVATYLAIQGVIHFGQKEIA